MIRVRWVIGALAGFVAIGSAYVLTRRAETANERYERDRAAQRAQSARAFGAVPVIPLGMVNGAERLAEVLAATHVEDEPGHTHEPGDVDAIIREVAGLFHARYGQTDPAVYIAWRLERGYAWRDRTTLLDVLRERATYQACTGRPPHDGQTLEELFTDVWACSLKHSKPYSRPRAIADDGQGLTLTFGSLRLAGKVRQYPRPNGRLGSEVWHAPPMGTPVSWFEPNPDGLTLLKERGTIRSATLGVTVECEDGSRFLMHFRLILRPHDQRWMIDMVTLSGFEHADTSALF